MRCHRHLRRARGEDDSPAAVEGEVDALLAALADRTGRAQSHPRGAGAIPAPVSAPAACSVLESHRPTDAVTLRTKGTALQSAQRSD